MGGPGLWSTETGQTRHGDHTLPGRSCDRNEVRATEEDGPKKGEGEEREKGRERKNERRGRVGKMGKVCEIKRPER